jgi:hypothetical protein
MTSTRWVQPSVDVLRQEKPAPPETQDIPAFQAGLAFPVFFCPEVLVTLSGSNLLPDRVAQRPRHPERYSVCLSEGGL